MKKRIYATILILTLLFVLSVQASASAVVTPAEDVTVIHHDDGTYTTIYPVEVVDMPQTAATGDARTTSGNVKAVNRDEDDGTTNWIYTLYGEFSYVEGVSSTCTRAYYTQTIYNDDWEFSNGNAYASANAAYGVGTFENSFWFIPIETRNIDFRILCDVYGTLS